VSIDPAEHLKVARRLHFQGQTQDAVREYLLVLELDPENEDARSGLLALGVEPPDPVARKAAYDGAQVKTNFFVNQAKEGHLPAWRTGPFKVVIGLLSVLLAWGVYTIVMTLLNFDNIKAADNVVAEIKKVKTKEDGSTTVDIQVANFNPGAIKDMVIHYTLSDEKGNQLKDGSLNIKTMVPAGEIRTFSGFDLGSLKGKPSKIEQKLASLIYIKPKKFSERLIDKYITAVQKPDKEFFSDFDEITQDADDFPPALIGMGRAYAARGDYKRAIEQFKKALDCDPDDANAHYRMAVALFYNGQKEEAKKEIDQASTLAPDDPQIMDSQRLLSGAMKNDEDQKQGHKRPVEED
jgi:tetratricopeptide (TPR) repeat protein